MSMLRWSCHDALIHSDNMYVHTWVRGCADIEPLGFRRPRTALESPQLDTERRSPHSVASTQVAPEQRTSNSQLFRSFCRNVWVKYRV